MHKLSHRLHLWLSIPMGIFIMVICLTGAILVFEPEITMAITHQAGSERLPFFVTVTKLHRTLLMGKPVGKWIVGISTLSFVVILVTGIIMWWKRAKNGLRHSLALPFNRGWRPFFCGLHVAGGMYVVLIVLTMAVTGLTWSFDWWREPFVMILGDDARRIIYFLHTGKIGGTFTRVVWLASALIAATLPLTGYYLWINKRGHR